MKNKKKFLIIGSNFSFNHYEYLKNKKNSEIHICSPNIYKKKFYKSCNLSKNYKFPTDVVHPHLAPLIQKMRLKQWLKLFPRVFINTLNKK